MRTALAVAIALGGAAGITSPAWAGPQDAPAAAPAAKGEIEVWDGYVWRDEKGRVLLGDPVIAMGVIAGPAQVIEGPLAKALEPWLVSSRDSSIFWNYTLEGVDPGNPESEASRKALDSLPKALVRLRGHVVSEGVTYFGSGQGTRTMTDARLRTIEWVDREWLVAWSTVFREQASPWRYREDTDDSRVGQRLFAPKALAALLAMRARPHPDEAAAKRAKAIDPDATVAERFRVETEVSIQRWLVEKSEKSGWKPAELAALPPLPPSSERIQALFIKMPTRAAFLEALKSLTTVDFASIAVTHYVKTKGPAGEGTTYVSVTAEQIRDDWTDEEYASRHAATLEVMRR